jgi:hypothetical protein
VRMQILVRYFICIDVLSNVVSYFFPFDLHIVYCMCCTLGCIFHCLCNVLISIVVL